MTRLKLRRHMKLVMALALVVTTLIVGAGDQPIAAYCVRDTDAVAGPVITYSHTLAVLVPEVGQASGVNISE